MSDMTIEDIKAAIASVQWMHRWDILPGVETPGKWGKTDPAQILDTHYKLPKDLKGLRALDIGALDGQITFELERRGATVSAVDIQDPDRTGFNTAKKILKSSATYTQGDVYELKNIFDEQFDVICFFGVWYHLKNPVRAFAQVASCLKDNGTLLAEGDCLFEYMEAPGVSSEDLRSLAIAIASSPVALTAYYPDTMNGDPYNWFSPNQACVEAWLKTSGMRAIHHSKWHDYPNQRLHITAIKDPSIMVLVDNPVW